MSDQKLTPITTKLLESKGFTLESDIEGMLSYSKKGIQLNVYFCGDVETYGIDILYGDMILFYEAEIRGFEGLEMLTMFFPALHGLFSDDYEPMI